jgi:hypothetical protein
MPTLATQGIGESSARLSALCLEIAAMSTMQPLPCLLTSGRRCRHGGVLPQLAGLQWQAVEECRLDGY